MFCCEHHEGVNSMSGSDVRLGKRRSLRGAGDRGLVRSIAVTSGNAGLGKTSIAVNLALGLARDGARVMLLDAGSGLSNVAVHLGLNIRSGLLNVLRGEKSLEEIIIDGPGNLMIVPAASGILHPDELGTAECAAIVRAFSALEHHIDTLVINTAAGISESVASFCAASSDVLVIAGNEACSLQDAILLIKLLHSDYAVARFHIVANRVQGAREGTELFNRILNQFADRHEVLIGYAGFVPCDDALRLTVVNHQAVVDAFPRSRSAMALKNLARRVAGWPHQHSPRGHLEFFIERLIQQNNVEMEVMS
jgi:flagellar biosynthesis protein FlhG